MEKKPKISFFISTYNSERTIGTCLKSIFSSLEIPRKDFEFIIVDNFSTDKTLEIAKKYPIDRIIKRKCNRAEARNIFLRIAKGEIVAMIESDKKVTKRLIKTCFSAFQKDKSLGFWAVTSVTPFFKELKKDFVKTVIFLFEMGEKHVFSKGVK